MAFWYRRTSVGCSFKCDAPKPRLLSSVWTHATRITMQRKSRCNPCIISASPVIWSNILRHFFEHLGHVCKNLGLYNLHSAQSLCHVELNVTDKEWILTHHLCNGGAVAGFLQMFTHGAAYLPVASKVLPSDFFYSHGRRC
jgi:hypothetical protein